MTREGETALQALRRCRKVAAGTDELVPIIRPVLPLVVDPAELGLAERTALTAFLKRFEQLQDLIGRTARAVLAWEGEDARAMTQRDVGHWLEKQGLLDDVEAWMEAARLRNRLAHEYPLEEAEQVRRVNETWAAMPLLRVLADGIERYAESKGVTE